jgi:hypothetical protein
LDVESNSSCGSIITADSAEALLVAAAAADAADDSADVFPTFDEVADASPALFRFDGAAMMFSNRNK